MQELKRSSRSLGFLFDEAKAKDRQPIDLLLERADFSGTRKLFGDELVESILAQLPTVPQDDRQAFIDQMNELAEPIMRGRIFDPEIRAQLQRTEKDTEVILTGPEDQPHLEMRIHAFDDQMRDQGHQPLRVELPDGTIIQRGDAVMEISWANQGQAPRGIKDAIIALRSMAATLKTRPEIKAVMAVSWMVGRHDLMDRLGLHIITGVDIPLEQQANVLDWASKGRADKPYATQPESKDVQLAMVSAKEFIERYG